MGIERIRVNNLFVDIKQVICITVTKPFFRQIFQSAEIVDFGSSTNESCDVIVAVDIYAASVDNDLVGNNDAVQIDVRGVDCKCSQRSIHKTVNISGAVVFNCNVSVLRIHNRIIGILYFTRYMDIHK